MRGRREDGMAGHPGGASIEGDLEKPAALLFPDGYDALYDYLAKTPPQNVSTPLKADDIAAALASAAHTITATHQSAFQSHASMTPGCCVADVKDGGATVWFGGQKPYRVRNAIVDLLGILKSKVRVIFYQGAGAYGTNDTDDVAVEAAWISQQVGQPVRLQWMRHEGIAWDPKGPPHLTTMRAGIDANNKVVAWDYNARMLTGTQRAAGALIAGDTLIGQAMGYKPLNDNEHGVPADNYAFPEQAAHLERDPRNGPIRPAYARRIFAIPTARRCRLRANSS
jgi:CO/xanthine dehydrogenase Mo-binding subunit